MPDNARSRVVTQGVQRSPNRTMLWAGVFGEDDFNLLRFSKNLVYKAPIAQQD